MPDVIACETEVIGLLLDALRRYLPEMRVLGIKPDPPELHVWKAVAESYASEFRVSFRKDGELVDILEQHIFWAGEPVAEIEDFRAWIDQNVADVLRKAAFLGNASAEGVSQTIIRRSVLGPSE